MKGATRSRIRPLKILGLNAFGHDAAAVLLVDGEVVFAASEERFDRVRHSAAFPRGAIAAALASAGIGPRGVDIVAFPWTRSMARGRKAWWFLRHAPASLAFLRERPDPELPSRGAYLRRMHGLEAQLAREGFRARLERVPHHLAHAASAALALPDATGAVVTADGMGEWTTTATWTVEAGRPRLVASAGYPHSAGKAYAAVTQWLGFRPESDEGKTMGLAPYGAGDSPAARFARSLVVHDPRRLLRVRRKCFDYPLGRARLWGRAFLRRAGPPRAPRAALEDRHRDVARGIQDAVEDAFLELARRLVAETSAAALGLAGGVFLNCALDGRLRRALPVPVRPFPVAGDAGAAWGAAALAWLCRAGRPAAPLSTLRLGRDLDREEGRAATGTEGMALDDLADRVAALVAEGALVGVARGRAEFGPRALGARSVLATPTTEASRDRVNGHKGREAWRPLAPVVRANDAALFHGLGESPWMILTFEATPEGRRLVPGAVHVDGTARVQTVTAGGEPLLWKILERLPAHDHPPCVLNTSFNRRGEPIVNTAAEALEAARAMRLDAVVLGDSLLALDGGDPRR